MKKWNEMTTVERNALVAEKVMGWTHVGFTRGITPRGERDASIPDYSAKISDAWEVFTNIKDRRFSTRERFMCELQRIVSARAGTMLISFSHLLFFITADAICFAALRAVGVEIK